MLLSLKWQINFLFLAQFVIISCLNMTDPYWPLIIHAFNQSLTTQEVQYWSAAIYITPFALTILSIPVWGHLGDRIGHKKMLIRASFALVLTQFGVGFLHDPLQILGLRMLQGIFAGYTAAGQAWAISQSKTEIHSLVLGRLQAGAAIGTIVGPIVGGIIANYFGYRSIFFDSAGICAIVVFFLAIFLSETTPKIVTNSEKKVDRFFRMDRTIYNLLLLITFTQAIRWMNSSFFALYVIHQLKGSNLSIGILYSASALAIFISASQWGYIIDKKLKRKNWIQNLLILILFIAAGSQCIFALSHNLYTAFIAALIWGVCLGATTLIPAALLVAKADHESKGKIIGFSNSANKLGNLIGVGLGALIQAQTNYTITFLIMSFFYLALALVIMAIRGYHTLLAPKRLFN